MMKSGGKILEIGKPVELRPGPTLDREIDRKIMGFNRSPELATPPYSTKWTYAMDVVEQLAPRWGFSLVMCGEKNVATFMERMPIVEGQGKQISAGAATGPMAVVTAALKAKALEPTADH